MSNSPDEMPPKRLDAVSTETDRPDTWEKWTRGGNTSELDLEPPLTGSAFGGEKGWPPPAFVGKTGNAVRPTLHPPPPPNPPSSEDISIEDVRRDAV